MSLNITIDDIKGIYRRLGPDTSIAFIVGVVGWLLWYSNKIGLFFVPRLVEAILSVVIAAALAYIVLSFLILRTRRVKVKRATLLDAMATLSGINVQPSIYSDSELRRDDDAISLAWKRLVELLTANEKRIFDVVFFKRFHPDVTLSNPTPINEEFCKEARNVLNEQGWWSPVVFDERGIWYRAMTIKEIKESIGSHKISPGLPTGKIRRPNLGGKFCAIVPCTLQLAMDKAHDVRADRRPFGFLGFVGNERIFMELSPTLKKLAEDFEGLYARTKEEKVFYRIDSFLNIGALRHLKLTREADDSHRLTLPQLFGDDLQKVLIAEFYADEVEVWLKGMEVSENASIKDIVEEILNLKYPIAIREKPVGDMHYLDSLLELDKCYLGLIRIKRRNVPFTKLETKLIEKICKSIDNYVRDLWEQHVARQIDHNVFNSATMNLDSFCKDLVSELTRHFDSIYGLVEIDNYSHVMAPIKSGSGDAALDIFQKLKKHNKDKAAILSVDKESCIVMPLNLGEKRLGTVYLVSYGKFTSLHLEALKGVEHHLDNILGLYLTFLSHIFTVRTRSVAIDTLREEEVKTMLFEYDFFHFDWCFMGRGIPHAYELKKNRGGRNIVIDRSTALVWQQGGSSNELEIWQAENYVQTLNDSRLGSFEDWRLPTLEEAMSLMIPKQNDRENSHIDSIFEKGQERILTSDKDPAGQSWIVDYGSGKCETVDSQRRVHIRAVRSDH